MPVAPSFNDLIEQYAAEAIAQRALVGRPAPLFLEGDMATAQQHGAGAMADAVIRYVAQAFKETFIDGAKGDALTALVDDHLNIQRSPKTSASVLLTLTRTSAGAGFSLPPGFVFGSEFDAAGNTVLFSMNDGLTWPNGSNGPIQRVATATVTGRVGNVGAAKVTRFVDHKPDATLAVTNAAAAAGGNEEESDDELKVRARNFWQTLRRGTVAALEFGALRVPSVRISRATEDAGTGIVTLVVTDSDGGSTAQMVADVILEIENWRAAGSIVTVQGGAALVVAVTGSLVGKSGVDTSVLGSLAEDAIAGRMRKLRQGETLYLDTIKAAGIGVDPDALDALTLSDPLVDVAPAVWQVIRPGIITIS